ncbi:RNA 2',3'-cyclic phosphodiesterase [Paenibacillus tritici]|uniref:RNA 2',3'-cyclic phosphodiesterase n=1 Tax=Paenibacillus tritici TaxID=1873425 RepID=A0ABX2DTB2_9BACL|nr:RNA 2',3'-cyclic phosphodiesterase [Paenibacillus tritici]NQX47402.1 RNA 2',3'-cyclic phosphodiesterase [Paenibacillus tritici]QUL55930.1 RNA 2',3'-cyclic phosphodiesterase [Paenibacillus tritici]
MRPIEPEQEVERLFVAIPLPDALCDYLKNESAHVSSGLHFARWTHFKDFHITLQFLGDTPREHIPALYQALREVAKSSKGFQLKLGEWGTFGLPDSPRVLWTGVSGELEPLKELQKRVVSATLPLGYTAEMRTYNPHLTLARKYRGEGSFTLERLENLRMQGRPAGQALPDIGWTVDAFVVYATRMYAIPMYEMTEKFTFFST